MMDHGALQVVPAAILPSDYLSLADTSFSYSTDFSCHLLCPGYKMILDALVHLLLLNSKTYTQSLYIYWIKLIAEIDIENKSLRDATKL